MKDAPIETLSGWGDSSHRASYGWPELFFAAGLILTDDSKVHWHEMVSVIHGMSGAFRDRVTKVFEHYSGEPLFKKSGSACIQADKLKKGMRIKLRNGWDAVVEKECDGNTIRARVHGDCTESGDIYVKDIASALVEDKWIKVAMSDEQRKFADGLSALFG